MSSITHFSELPASLIFAPKVLKHFACFQRHELVLPNQKIGKLPSASQYADFLLWSRKRKQSPSLNDFTGLCDTPEPEAPNDDPILKTADCGHILHPVTKIQSVIKCPKCVVTEHLDYLKVLSTALEKAANDLKHHPSVYVQALEAYSSAKMESVMAVYKLELQAEEEMSWQRDRVSIWSQDTMSANVALEYHRGQTDPYAKPKQNEKRRRTRKHVTFSQETNFDTGRNESYFWRKSDRYEPGKYQVEESVDMGGGKREDVVMDERKKEDVFMGERNKEDVKMDDDVDMDYEEEEEEEVEDVKMNVDEELDEDEDVEMNELDEDSTKDRWDNMETCEGDFIIFS
ncbi:hypothetical protein EJ04DRAFT_361779 [Polyplosphaeria fusca]|uniref:Uncharacterized protein n=1 Tax=Polyplosphaeria fusca TaxID=682080 RepID=A0A9P4V121_9PLEO|nr:hypothetical protein EJ04DRAFT_361779 [Polyplosphaeria fusca]